MIVLVGSQVLVLSIRDSLATYARTERRLLFGLPSLKYVRKLMRYLPCNEDTWMGCGAALSPLAEVLPGSVEARGASSDCAALAAAISSSVPGLGYSHASGASTMMAFSAGAGSCEDGTQVSGVRPTHTADKEQCSDHRRRLSSRNVPLRQAFSPHCRRRQDALCQPRYLGEQRAVPKILSSIQDNLSL